MRSNAPSKTGHLAVWPVLERGLVRAFRLSDGPDPRILMASLRIVLSVLLTLLFVQVARAGLIVVDAGHTPQQPGAISLSGREELRYHLDLSAAIARELEGLGEHVARVGADGEEISLSARATRHPEADLFVSIHHDSMQQEWIDAGRRQEFSGFSLFVSEKNPAYGKSLACAQAIGEALLAAGERPSLYHATPIPGENRPLLDAGRGVHRFDDLVVLKTASMPAVLVEAGVIANPDEEERLASSETVQKLAHAIAKGIQACRKP